MRWGEICGTTITTGLVGLKSLQRMEEIQPKHGFGVELELNLKIKNDNVQASRYARGGQSRTGQGNAAPKCIMEGGLWCGFTLEYTSLGRAGVSPSALRPLISKGPPLVRLNVTGKDGNADIYFLISMSMK